MLYSLDHDGFQGGMRLMLSATLKELHKLLLPLNNIYVTVES